MELYEKAIEKGSKQAAHNLGKKNNFFLFFIIIIY
jgi:hypothetical protein